MFDSFSAFGFLVHTPCGPRKSGMPDSVEMPAPVRTTTRPAWSIHPLTVASVTASVDMEIHERRFPDLGDAPLLRSLAHGRPTRHPPVARPGDRRRRPRSP